MVGEHAAGCLGDDTILTFAQGLTDEIRAREVRVHLDACDECRTLVAEAGRAIYDDASGLKTALEQTQESSDQLRAGSAIDRYLILGLVGQGGMGVVYSAFDPQLRRKVAVKLLRADSQDVDSNGEHRLLREAQAMAQLSHPNVVQVYDLGVAGNQVFVAMEYIEGLTLTRWLKAEPRTVDQILDAFAWAGLGLSAAHAAGIVHRDFKTSNVLLSADGRVRVTDFGLARAITEAAPEPREPSAPRTPRSGDPIFVTVTETGALIGTPAYMAPEQFGGAPCDARADQFTFCVTLYEALYRLHPFADALETPMPALLGNLPPRPEGTAVPEAVHAVLERGLEREPEARFASMDELLRALDVARVTPAPARGGRTAVLFAAVAAALIVLAIVVLWGRPDERAGAAPADRPAPAAATAKEPSARAETAPPARAPVEPAPPPPSRAPVDGDDIRVEVEETAPAAEAPVEGDDIRVEVEETAPAAEETSAGVAETRPRATSRAKDRSTRTKKTPPARRKTREESAAPTRPKEPTGPKENPDGLIRDLWKSED